MQPCNKVMVATLGFDEKFVQRALLDYRPCILVALGLYTGDEAWDRTQRSFDMLRIFARGAGVGEARLERIELSSPRESPARLSYKVKKTLWPLVREAGETLFFLTAGSRLLVAAALIAAVSMALRLRRASVRVRIDGEGYRYSFTGDALDLSPVPPLLRDPPDELLCYLAEAGLRGEALGPTELSRLMGRSKSAIHERLRRLEEAGLVARTSGGKYEATDACYAAAVPDCVENQGGAA